MIRSMMALASGMKAQQLNVDTISNNLANVNTTGFKASKVLFQDMLYENVRNAGDSTTGVNAPGEAQLGLGTSMVSITKSFTQGNLQQTGNSLNLAIQGDGFFCVKDTSGNLFYSRDGAFTQDSTGKIVNSNGYQLNGVDALDPNATAVTIGTDGTISETVNGQTTSKGQIQLYRFINSAGLHAMGQNLFQETTTSGKASAGVPGVDGMGTLSQGMLETSNVDVVNEMVNLIVAQRAYEMNSKAMQASDEMMQASNNLKR